MELLIHLLHRALLLTGNRKKKKASVVNHPVIPEVAFLQF